MTEFYVNCREDIDEIYCKLGNISAVISSTCWFIILIPQIYINFKFKSTDGLSLYWAIANFSASLFSMAAPFHWKLGYP